MTGAGCSRVVKVGSGAAAVEVGAAAVLAAPPFVVAAELTGGASVADPRFLVAADWVHALVGVVAAAAASPPVNVGEAVAAAGPSFRRMNVEPCCSLLVETAGADSTAFVGG